MTLTTLFLKRRQERRLRGGHPWVFSNEVDVERSPLAEREPGEAVQVCEHGGRVIGSGYVNPGTLISVRLYSREAGVALDRRLLEERVRRALSLRERLFRRPFYRLVYGESDGLPGLVVDRYGKLLVVQMGTAGMDRVKDDVLAVLAASLHPSAMVLRNDVSGRELEGLGRYVETPLGQVSGDWELEENGAVFCFDPVAGHKTGWYLDHRFSRARLAPYVEGARVLDLFSYLGAWGIQAALQGAASVVCVDASGPALEGLAENAARNGVGERVRTLRGDAFDVLKELAAAGERFDVVIADPPAFIKRKKDLKAGTEAYRRLNQLAARLLRDDGFLVSSSCSYRMPRTALVEAVGGAAHHLGRTMQVLEHGGQGPDHPVHPALPETEYLKAVFARISAG